MRKREVYVSDKFYEGKMIPTVMYTKRAPLRKLYELLVADGYPIINLTDTLRGVCVYRAYTEGGIYDEALYLTSSGLVLYGLIPYADETPKAMPVMMHECPVYEEDPQKIVKMSEDGLNQLPAIVL